MATPDGGTGPEVRIVSMRPAEDPPAAVEAGEEVSHPSRVFRLASMIKALLDQVDSMELDDAARHRLASVYNHTIDALRELLSEDLRNEVDALELRLSDDPSTAELQVAHAQLVGWLEGLFHGIRATMIAHDLATQAELTEAFQKGRSAAREEERGSGTGHYM